MKTLGVLIKQGGILIVDEIDKKLLLLLQDGLPLSPKPYHELADTLNISVDEVFKRIYKMKNLGVIRRISGVFNSWKLGYKSTLCAARVPEHKIEMVKEIVNSFPGVTHNYLREHTLNMWFTLIEPSEEEIEETIVEIEKNTGLQVIEFPAQKIYKINAKFQIP